MPDFLVTSRLLSTTHTRSRLCLMFGPEPVAMETTSLGQHPQCTSWQRQLEPSCHQVRATPWVAQRLSLEECAGQADFRSFLKILSQTLGEEVSFIPHCHGTAPDSFVLLVFAQDSCAQSSQHCVAQTSCSPHLVDACPSGPPGILGVQLPGHCSPHHAQLFCFFSVHSYVLGCYLHAK